MTVTPRDQHGDAIRVPVTRAQAAYAASQVGL